jgi:archaellum component FlaC
METMTSRWTDERMDDLKHQVDELGRRMEAGFSEQRKEMNARFDRLEKGLEVRFDKVDERFEKVDARFERVDVKFEAVNEQIARTQEMVIGLHVTLTRFSLGFLGAAIVAVIAALLAS